MNLSTKAFPMAGALALALLAPGAIAGAAAGTLFVSPVSQTAAGAADVAPARFVPRKRPAIRHPAPLRRPYARRRVYAPGPAVALGALGAALATGAGPYPYPAYDRPGAYAYPDGYAPPYYARPYRGPVYYSDGPDY